MMEDWAAYLDGAGAAGRDGWLTSSASEQPLHPR